MIVKANRTDFSIKNMVCNRCIRVVRKELENLGYEVLDVQLGKAVLGGRLSVESKARIKKVLDKNGFALLEDKNARIVEVLKTAIINLIYGNHLEDVGINLSDYLSSKLGKDYYSLSELFSAVAGTTIEQFFILHKMEPHG